MTFVDIADMSPPEDIAPEVSAEPDFIEPLVSDFMAPELSAESDFIDPLASDFIEPLLSDDIEPESIEPIEDCMVWSAFS